MVINRRIALSFLTIAAVLAAVVGITYAAFTDTASLTGNTLSTGSASLKIQTASGDTCGGTNHESVAGITTTHMGPGQTSVAKQFCLNNISDTGQDLAVNAAVGTPSGDLTASLVSITINCNTGTGPVSGDITSYPSDIIIHLAPGTPTLCTITQSLSSSATDSDSGKTATYDVTFTGATE